MLASFSDPFSLRMLERCLVAILGGMSLWLGYLLFKHGVVIDQRGEIKILDSFHLKAMRMAPGVFFAAFGCFILVTNIVSAPSWKKIIPKATQDSGGAAVIEEWSGVSAGGKIAFDQCIASLNTLREDITDSAPDYFNDSHTRAIPSYFRQTRDLLLWHHFSARRETLAKYFDARKRGVALKSLGTSSEEIDTLLEIERVEHAWFDTGDGKESIEP